ncbi:MAG TPA: glycosyltransferase family 1 protein [Chloroflexi bacterium]|nr:glycosyltransferase family 1 protein [Chloroflexota bacterium]|tara:strand:- start:5328 stop:6476 length:1149 start_codon:yes stop_codon:yes gene_type:complete
MKIGIEVTAALTQTGGIGRYVREMLSALSLLDSDNKYHLFYASNNNSKSHIELPKNSFIRRVPVHDIWLARIWHRMRFPLPVEYIIGNVDVYHSPDFTLPPTLKSTSTLLTIHDLSFLRHPSSAAPGLRQYLTVAVQHSVNRATHILADSESTKNDLIELYKVPFEKVSVIYPGVSSDFRPVSNINECEKVRIKYNLGDQPFVLSVGTLQPRKNHSMLIRAFDLALRDSNYNLVLAGGVGWEYDEVFELVRKLDLKERVLFPGFVEDLDLPALYSSSSIMGFPSIYEGFGLPVIEAMACGVPVFVSTSSCLPEVVGQSALLVDPYDLTGMADTLSNLIFDLKLRENLRSKGLDRAKLFSWEDAANKLLQIYCTLGNTKNNYC